MIGKDKEYKKRRAAASFDRVESIPQEKRNSGKAKPKHTAALRPFGQARAVKRLQTCENKITPNFRSNWLELGGGGGGGEGSRVPKVPRDRR